MQLSVTTDYAADTGDPSPYLRRIAKAGFSHLHWCHHWNTDFVYSPWEIGQIREWLVDYGLELLDLHGSVGPEKNWASEREFERLAGTDLVKNRLEMTARLGGQVVIMHAPREMRNAQLLRSLDALEPVARSAGVRIAIENTHNFPVVDQLLQRYDADYLGLCYDSGHGNMSAQGLDRLEALKERLISVHLHDNDGTADQHLIPFTGTVDWARLTRIIAESAYAKPASLEVSMRNANVEDEEGFLSQTFEAGLRLDQMIQKARGTPSGA